MWKARMGREGGSVAWCWAAALCVASVPSVPAETLADAPSPKAIEAIQLLDSKDPYDRQLGFLRLEALREPATLPVIQQYSSSEDADTRAYSLRAIAAIQGAEAVPFLLERFKSEKHQRVRLALLLALEALQEGRPEVLAALIRALRDRSTEVRMCAVDIISRIHEPSAREALLSRNRRERRRDVRRVLDLAMKRIAGH